MPRTSSICESTRFSANLSTDLSRNSLGWAASNPMMPIASSVEVWYTVNAPCCWISAVCDCLMAGAAVELGLVLKGGDA
jgi:hypothetical protein